MADKTYTIEEIKQAFYDEFHEAGDVHFAKNGADWGIKTNQHWSDFVTALVEVKSHAKRNVAESPAVS